MKTKNIAFTKYNSTGNDFIVFDNRNAVLKGKEVFAFTRSACAVKTGIGADGVLLLEKSKKADFKMRIINADGSEPEMCGNGARCMAHFAYSINYGKRSMVFETIAGLINGKIINKNRVKVKLIKPFDLRRDICIKYKNKTYLLSFINTSVPHVVCFVNNINKPDVINFGQFIRYHKLFKPAGTNVNFVQVKDKSNIIVRTYERGVEDETLACGTGSTASALMSSIVKKTSSPVTVKTKGNDLLKIYFSYDQNTGFDDVFLEGDTIPVFSGITKFNLKKVFID